MIQYIVAAGIGGLLGLRRKKGKKFADGGTTDGMIVERFADGGVMDDDEARAKKEYMEDYGVDAEEAEEQFQGVFRDKEDFAADLVEETGFDSFIDNERFLEPDKIGFREWASNLADAMASDIDEDNADEYAERLGLEDEYEEAEEKGGQAMEDFLDELRQKEAEELYDEFMRQGGSADDIIGLVSDYGMSAEDAIDAYLVRIDYEEIADALEDDGYVYIEQGSEVYVFNSNMARGGMTKMAEGGQTKLETRMVFFEAQEFLDEADKALSRGGDGFGDPLYVARKAIDMAGEKVIEAVQMMPREEGIDALGIIMPPLKKAQAPSEKASTKLDAIGETQRAIYKVLRTIPSIRLAKGGKTQGYNDKLDESLGSRRGAGRSKEQSREDRRDESEAMEKSMGRRKYAAVGTMDEGDRMMAKGGKTKKIGFDKLAEEVAEEYREKGMSKAEAEEIGKGTAAKVFRAQQAKKNRKK